jgi:xanthine dehydrogenase accessory factor
VHLCAIIPAMRVFEELARLEKEGASCVLCTVLETKGSVPQKSGSKMVVREDGSIVGTVGGGALEHEVRRRAARALEAGEPELYEAKLGPDLGMACGGAVSVFVEPLFAAPDLILVGAGHIGRDLCAMASRAGFRVSVVDARAEWAVAEAFPDAAAVLAEDPVAALDDLPLGPDAYVVLVSHSHDVDQRVLGEVAGRDWRYLGMIASKRKVKQVFAALEEQGVDPAQLAQVHSPIGLKIGSIDPGEIAVSILAELIRVRREKPEDPATSFKS